MYASVRCAMNPRAASTDHRLNLAFGSRLGLVVVARGRVAFAGRRVGVAFARVVASGGALREGRVGHDRAARAGIELGDAPVGHGDVAFDDPGLLRDDGVVTSRDEGEANGGARGFLDVGHHGAARALLHEDASLERRRKIELRPGLGRESHGDLALTGEVGLEGHVLLADLRPGRRGERAAVRVAVRLVERHPAVAVAVARPTERGHEVVREVRRLQLVGLLTEFLGGARSHDREALLCDPGHGVVREVRRGLGALHAREGSALAGVEDDDGDRGRDGAEPVAQRRQGQLLVAEVDRVGARVTREIKKDLRLISVLGVRACARGRLVDGGEQVLDVGTEKDPDVARLVVSELDEHLGNATRVVFGESERLLSRPTDVVAHDDGVRVGVSGCALLGVGAGDGGGGEDPEAAQHERGDGGAGGRRGSGAGMALHGLSPVNSRPPRHGNPSPRISGGPLVFIRTRRPRLP